MAEIIKSSEDSKIYLTGEIKEIIKDLIRGKTYLLNKEEFASLSNGEISEKSFKKIYSGIINSFANNLRSLKVYLDDSNANFDQSMLEELRTLQEEYEKAKEKLHLNDYSYMLSDDYSQLEYAIELIYKYIKVEKRMFLIRDLSKAKDDYIIDMKYFMSEDLIKKFEVEYSEALQEKNADKMLTLLNQVQQLILKEWEKYDGNIADMTDDNFCFIGHSTCSSQFNGNFFSRYVSCSLFNQNLNDTYRRPFGFVMAPKNIIGANSYDMFVYNYAADVGDTLLYSSVPIIHHPKRLIEECIAQKIKNIEANDEREVYNEVFIDGFNPIGIFCFTNGAKELDDNYCAAIRLQKSFPNLKIKFFDIMKNKKGIELQKMQLELITSLLNKKNYNNLKIGFDELSRYELFFQKFDELKQKGDYTEKDIEAIFLHNLELLSISYYNLNDLFDGKLNDEEIKYVLGKNYKYNIEAILNGNITAYSLENLKSLIKYVNQLNKYYDGLSEFVLLISKISIDDEIVNEIKSDLPTNFYKMSKCLVKKLEIILNDKEHIIQSELNSLKERYHVLIEEYNKRKEIQDKYQFYSNILDNEFVYSILHMDLESLKSYITRNDKGKSELIKQKEALEKRINELNMANDGESSKNIQEHSEYQNIQNEIRNLKEQLVLLRKHAIINIRKIRFIENKIRSLERESEIISIEFERNRDSEIDENNLTIDFLKEELSDIIECLNEIKEEGLSYQEQKDAVVKKILELFKCKTLEEVIVRIQEAKVFVSNYNHDNELIIQDIKRELQEINDQILSHEKTLTEIDEEKRTISK